MTALQQDHHSSSFFIDQSQFPSKSGGVHGATNTADLCHKWCSVASRLGSNRTGRRLCNKIRQGCGDGRKRQIVPTCIPLLAGFICINENEVVPIQLVERDTACIHSSNTIGHQTISD